MMSVLRKAVAIPLRRGRYLGHSNALLKSCMPVSRRPQILLVEAYRPVFTQIQPCLQVRIQDLQTFRPYGQYTSATPPYPYFVLEPPVTMEKTIERIRKVMAYPGISTETLAAWIAEAENAKIGLVILDVREPEEFAVSHVDGAMYVSPRLEDVEATYDHIHKLHEGRTKVRIACICAIGYRASIYAKALQDYIQKQTDSSLKQSASVHIVEGSVLKWANERRPLVDPHGNPTSKAHPKDANIGVLLDKELHSPTFDDPEK